MLATNRKLLELFFAPLRNMISRNVLGPELGKSHFRNQNAIFKYLQSFPFLHLRNIPSSLWTSLYMYTHKEAMYDIMTI
jgi:hypothetical protein